MASDTADILYDPLSSTLHVVWVDRGDTDNSGVDADIYYLAATVEDF